MFTSEHAEVIEGRRRLIYTYVIDSKEAAKDGMADDYGTDLDEEDESGSGKVGENTDMVTAEIEESEKAQQAVKHAYIFVLYL